MRVRMEVETRGWRKWGPRVRVGASVRVSVALTLSPLMTTSGVALEEASSRIARTVSEGTPCGSAVTKKPHAEPRSCIGVEGWLR